VTTSSPEPAQLAAPAKLTLSLRITGTRRDGYHLLESEMVTVDLMDTLQVEEGDGLTIATDPAVSAGWPPTSISVGSDNLVTRALAAAGRTARIHIVKRIPPGAGLGGGSADAAAILRWAGCAEQDVAVGLGADVPFCLVGGRALVRGVGEEVEALPYVDRRFTLLLVPFGVETAAVYRAWDQRASTRAGGRAASSSNDLEAAAVAVEARLAAWRIRLEEVTGRRAHLAGSGSTWFVEGSPEEVGLGDRRSLQLDGEEATLVPVRTTPMFD
jgi:4-diphosphocytidyl-2-C-methyl-D-erythritol kinase